MHIFDKRNNVSCEAEWLVFSFDTILNTATHYLQTQIYYKNTFNKAVINAVSTISYVYMYSMAEGEDYKKVMHKLFKLASIYNIEIPVYAKLKKELHSDYKQYVLKQVTTNTSAVAMLNILMYSIDNFENFS